MSDRNIVITNWTTASGMIGAQYPYIADNAFNIIPGSSPVFQLIGKHPTTLYSIREEPDSVNVYLNINSTVADVDSKKLLDLAYKLKLEEGIGDNYFNIAIDYATQSIFSYGDRVKQKIGREWKKYLHNIDIYCTQHIPEGGYLFLVNNDYILCNNKSYAKDFLFLLSLATLDYIFDTLLEEKSSTYYPKNATYTQPSETFVYFVYQWLIQVLSANKIGIGCAIEHFQMTDLFKTYSRILPLYQEELLTDEVDNLTYTCSFPFYFKSNNISKTSLTLLPEETKEFVEDKKEVRKRSLIDILQTNKISDVHGSLGTSVIFDLPEMDKMLPYEDIINSFVKANPISFHIYIVIRDGSYVMDIKSNVEIEIQNRAKNYFNTEKQKLYAYIISEDSYKLNFLNSGLE